MLLDVVIVLATLNGIGLLVYWTRKHRALESWRSRSRNSQLDLLMARCSKFSGTGKRLENAYSICA